MGGRLEPIQPPILLLTRPLPAARAFAARVAETGVAHVPLIAPLTAVAALAVDPAVLDGAGGVILTSANAARALIPPPGLRAWCVGPATTRAAQQAGYDAHQAGTDAESLCSALIAAQPKGPLVHLHGAHLAVDIVQRLTQAGIAARGVQVYDSQPVAWDDSVRAALDGARVIVAPVFSPRGAQALSAALGPRPAQRVITPAISRAAATDATAPIAATKDQDGMLRATVAALRESAGGA